MPSTAHIPQYLYPFLNTTSKTRPFDHLRLASLGVIGPLSKFVLSAMACEALTGGLPAMLKDGTFNRI
ncbi:Cell differentiation protein rcd1 [Musa troglodytarum]|uniref:Cell differentiation protein rcd1 n=1 Tax=Musa troglodytarum TaxID=320322 RepID=A0A9E7H0T3_9LILI|nr:Cell differentiation protein rcd1 [Musa troglodytarum]